MSLVQKGLAPFGEFAIDLIDDLGAEESESPGPNTSFAVALDSMAMVEFLGVVADDCGCEISAIEQCVDQRFSTVAELAHSIQSAGLGPTHLADRVEVIHEAVGLAATPGARAADQLTDLNERRAASDATRVVWLAGATWRLPETVQLGPALDAAVGRPTGWLERRAGILQRCVWADEDPLDAAAACAADALRDARVPRERVGALITVSEAPPIPVGLAAAVHDRLELTSSIACYEMGGACTGFLSALSLARAIVSECGPILIVSVESHSRLLPLKPGPHGESAALFGDGCSAVVLGVEPGRGPAVRLVDLKTYADGGAADLIRVRQADDGSFCLEMDGVLLTEFALHALATATRHMIAKYGLSLARLGAIVAHGGNGRMPAIVARQLDLPTEKVWSTTAETGNLGSASLPAAWAARPSSLAGPVAWAAVGAGLTSAAALTGSMPKK